MSVYMSLYVYMYRHYSWQRPLAFFCTSSVLMFCDGSVCLQCWAWFLCWFSGSLHCLARAMPRMWFFVSASIHDMGSDHFDDNFPFAFLLGTIIVWTPIWKFTLRKYAKIIVQDHLEHKSQSVQSRPIHVFWRGSENLLAQTNVVQLSF